MQETWRLIAMALLLTVAAHAAAPIAQPLDRTAGSAFSAATADVSLTRSERVLVAKTALPNAVAPPPFAAPQQTLPARVATTVPLHRAGFDATGPPPAQTSFRPLNPRAPPAA